MEYHEYLEARRAEWGDATIALIREGWDARLAAQVAADDQRKARAQAEAEERNALDRTTATALSAATPEALAVIIPTFDEQLLAHVAGEGEFDLKRHNPLSFWFTMAPGMADLLLRYYPQGQAREWAFNGLSVRDFEVSDAAGPEWRGVLHVGDASISEVLHLAAARGFAFEQARDAWFADQVKRDLEQQVRKARWQQQQAENQADRAERAAVAAEEERDLARLIYWAENDPAALNLIRTFMEIERQREDVREKLEAMAEANESAEYRYSERLAAANLKADDYRRQAEQHRDEARRHQDEAEDLERKLKTAQRNGQHW